MKRVILFLFLGFLSFCLYGQDTKNLKIIKDSESIIRKAIKLTDNDKIEDAIALYNQIPYGDPNYENAQYEKAYALEIAERYQEAIRILNELLENPSCSQPLANIYTELGNCYDDIEDFDKAVFYYNKGLETNPYYFHLHFNKGVSLVRQEKYTEAIECFKTSMFLNPAHQGSHFQYGMTCLRLGYTIPGIMALNYCTLINPNSNYTILALRTLDEIYESGVGSFNANNHYSLHEDYKELNSYYDEVVSTLNNSIFAQKKERCLSKINHPITRGNQVVFKNVQVRPNSNTVENQLYIPFFKQVMDERQFNTFCYYQLSGTDIQNDKVAAKAKKMVSELNSFQKLIINKLDEIIEQGLNQENPGDIHYIYEQYLLNRWGAVSRDASGQLVEQGLWTSIDRSGQLQETIPYKDGVLNGNYIFYSNNRKVAEIQVADNKRNGSMRTYSYHPFGDESVLTLDANTVNNTFQGRYKHYYESGIISQDFFIGPNEELTGESRTYDEQGNLLLLENYVNGTTVGLQKQFYPNGQLKGTYETDTATQHPFVSYYPNGNVSLRGFITNNVPTGRFNEFYPNGELKELYNYNDKGEYLGNYIIYYPNTQLHGTLSYKDGKLDGDRIDYDCYGKPVVTYHVKDGHITHAETYMPDGTVRATHYPKDKHITAEIYSSLGNLTTIEERNDKLELDGKQLILYPNGEVFFENHYKNNKLDGFCKQYYPSGNIFSYIEYKDDAQNGLSILYYDNQEHSVAQEQQFRNDTMVGACYAYLNDGSLKSKGLYDQNGKLIYYAYYTPDGKMTREIRYFNGLPLLISSFDLDGQLVHRDTVLFGNGHSDYYHPNGNIMVSREIKGGEPDGTSIEYSLDGRILNTYHRFSGSIVGAVRSFFPTGETKDSCSVTLDVIDGALFNYDPLGHPISSVQYGGYEASQGPKVLFFPDGKKLCECNSIDNAKYGPESYYAPDGKTLLLEVIYNQDAPYQYRFRQKDGSFSEAKVLPKEHIQINACYPNGKTGIVAEFENGFLNGNFIVYYPNGQAAYISGYVNGYKDGQETFFFTNGKTSAMRSFNDGALHGAMEYFYENGQKAYEGNYYYGLAHGDFKKYDKSGKLVHKVSMHYDRCTADERY